MFPKNKARPFIYKFIIQFIIKCIWLAIKMNFLSVFNKLYYNYMWQIEQLFYNKKTFLVHMMNQLYIFLNTNLLAYIWFQFLFFLIYMLKKKKGDRFGSVWIELCKI